MHAPRIVVTGRQGQVARAPVELGPRAGIEVRSVARPEFDLIRTNTVEAAVRSAQPDAIVSAAAYTAVDKAESESDLALAINAEGTGEVARTAAALAVPIVHLSTDYVFAGDKPTPYIEDDPVGPLNVCGASKLAGERAVVASTADYVILRASWVYSPFGVDFVKDHAAASGPSGRWSGWLQINGDTRPPLWTLAVPC